MNSQILKNLGWEPYDLWNNREFYIFKDAIIAIHLHDDSVYYVNSSGRIKYDCKFNESTLIQYTDIIKRFNDMKEHPDKYTLEQYNTALKLRNNFYKFLNK